VNDLLQWKLDKAGNDLGRFAINTTFGVLGFFDPAGAEGIAPGKRGPSARTLGVWGMPAGPYLVLPFFGPSSPRDASGLVVDTLLSPEFYFAPWYVSTPVTSTRVINARSLALEDGARGTRFGIRFLRSRTERLRAVSRQPGSRPSCRAGGSL
jgi:phospholipid-binding lipoprotein MlaA